MSTIYKKKEREVWSLQLFERHKRRSWLHIYRLAQCTGKNGFVTGTKLGTTNEMFVASTQNFATATKRFADRTKHFVVVKKYFCYPYFNKWLC